jgi:hypothetical protein
MKNGGIVFWRTKDLATVRRSYEERLGMRAWVDQGARVILRYGNMLGR